MTFAKGNDGKFIRTREEWTSFHWDEGYVDNNGRFRVYRPDYPRAYSLGYALRAHVVWWLKNGCAHPLGTNLHHRNGDRLDDRFINLELMSHADHTKHHCSKGDVTLICKFCQRRFEVKVRKFNSRNREGRFIKYCSQHCYHQMPRSMDHKAAISRGLKRSYLTGKRSRNVSN